MFNNVYKTSILQRKIVNVSIIKNVNNNTSLYNASKFKYSS